MARFDSAYPAHTRLVESHPAGITMMPSPVAGLRQQIRGQTPAARQLIQSHAPPHAYFGFSEHEQQRTIARERSLQPTARTEALTRSDSKLHLKGLVRETTSSSGVMREDSMLLLQSPRQSIREMVPPMPRSVPGNFREVVSPVPVWRPTNNVRSVQVPLSSAPAQAPHPWICVANPSQQVVPETRPSSPGRRGVNRIVSVGGPVLVQTSSAEVVPPVRSRSIATHETLLQREVTSPPACAPPYSPLSGSISSLSGKPRSSRRDVTPTCYTQVAEAEKSTQQRGASAKASPVASHSGSRERERFHELAVPRALPFLPEAASVKPELLPEPEPLQWREGSVVDEPEQAPEPSESPQGKEADADAAFPTTGRHLVLKIMCSYTESNHPVTLGSFEGYKITSDWKLCHLLKVTEMMTGIMRSSQKLYHAGCELPPGTTIQGIIGVKEDSMPDRFTVHVIVNEERFPQHFGPLQIAEVPLKRKDFMMPNCTKGGFHWMMKTEVVERFGVRSPSDKQVTAQCSPTHRIPFSSKERAEVGIPPEAVEFAWSNPVANSEQVEQDPHLLDDWGLSPQDSSLVKDFLAMGGFIFLNKEQKIVQVTAVRLTSDTDGGLKFRRRQKWQACWTKALIGDGCFHRVTCGSLKNAGAQFFCWLRPGETFVDDDGRPFDRQPEVPHGGFAFLFHEMGATSPQELVVDCYFAIDCIEEQVLSPGKSTFDLDDEDGHDCPTALVGHTTAQLNHHKMCAFDG